MTVRERVIASRLFEKTDRHGEYAKRIGLSCALVAVRVDAIEDREVQKKKDIYIKEV